MIIYPPPPLPMQIRKFAELSDCGTYRWTLERQRRGA